jgi:hypothetical protein
MKISGTRPVCDWMKILLWINLMGCSFGLLVLVESLVWFLPPMLVAGLFLVFWSVLWLGMLIYPFVQIGLKLTVWCMLELNWLSFDLICINLLLEFHMTLWLKLVPWYLIGLRDVVSCCGLSVFFVIIAGSIISVLGCSLSLLKLLDHLGFCW